MKHLPLLLSLCLFAGCASLPTADNAGPPSRSAGYAALYNLTNRNAGIGKLLIFKTVDPPVKQAVDDFAKQCADAARQLKQFADDDPSINLKTEWLTPIEKMARAGIESDTSSALLTGFGKEFQTNLLISQTDAAQYGSHLAASLAKLDDDDARKKYLNDLADQLMKAHQRLFKLLVPPPPEAH